MAADGSSLHQEVYGFKSGKGGGAGASPREAPNTLFSRQIARVLDLLSEGEIKGLVNGAKSVFYDKTPVQAADGTFNVQGVTLSVRKGTANQAHIPGFPAAESVQAVGIEVLKDFPITRRVDDLDANAVRVAVQVPVLAITDTKTGNTDGHKVQIKIYVKADADNGASVFVERVNDIIEGKTTKGYERSYRVDLTGTGPWDVRVERVSADETLATRNNQTFWTSYTVLIDRKLIYPDCALIGQVVNSEFFGDRIPERGFEIDGILVNIPSNYNPVSRGYSGAWDGTFEKAFTTNPAWILNDLCIHERYGLGELFEQADVDKWTLYTIAQYCDELVSDGKGGTEPRFQLNVRIATREDAIRVLEAVAGMMRCSLLFASGILSAVQDRPKSAVKLFTPANVVDGLFNYAGTSLTARHTVALVQWVNPDKGYEVETCVVEDAASILRYGYNELPLAAFGTTNYGQANRLGLYALATERLETDTVMFKVGLADCDVMPGDIIKIADPVNTQAEHGGRFVSFDLDGVVLDRPFDFEPGKSYNLVYMVFNGTVGTQALINPGIETDTVQFTTPITVDDAPANGGIFAIETPDVLPRPFRVLQVTEDEDHQTAKVFAVQYESTKFTYVDTNTKSQSPPTDFSDLPDPALVSPVSDIEFDYHIRFINGVQHGEITISWEPSPTPYIRRYRCAVQQAGGNWVEHPNVYGTEISILDPTIGIFRVAVYAVSNGGKLSKPVFKDIDLSTGGLDSKTTVYSLQIQGGGSTFTGRNIPLEWEYRSPYTLDNATLPIVGNDPFLKHFVVELQPSGGGAALAEYTTHTPNFVLDYAKLIQAGSLARAYRIVVYAVDINDNASNSITLNVSNPAPALPTVVVIPKAQSVIFQIPQPFDADFAGYLIWMDTTDGFTPGPSNLVWNGAGSPVVPVDAFVTYYYRYAAFDAFGQAGLNISAQGTFDTPRLSGNDIGEAILTTAMFAADITPVEIFDPDLPLDSDPGNFEGRLGFQVSDGQLYKFTGGLWEPVGITDLGEMVGQITSTQIEDDAITTPKLAANAVTANELAANSVTAGKIAAAAVSATEIAAGAIVAGKLAANAVVASNIAANQVTADKIGAGTLTVSWTVGSSAKLFLDGVNNRILITD